MVGRVIPAAAPAFSIAAASMEFSVTATFNAAISPCASASIVAAPASPALTDSVAIAVPSFFMEAV